jgi:hypothetical protein
VLRGAGAARVDHHHLSAARADRVEPREQVGRGEQAPLRRVRVRAHHDQVVGAVEVGDRERPHPAEQERRRDVLRPLVDRARRVETLDPRHRRERGDIAREREVVRGRVADVDRDGIDAVSLDHRVQAALHLGERLVPGDLVEGVAAPDERGAQAVGVVVQLAERGALRADVALAPHIVLVRADLCDAAVLHGDLEAAHRLTERAGVDVDSIAGLAHSAFLS